MKKFFAGSFFRTAFLLAGITALPAAAIVVHGEMDRRSATLRQAETRARNTVRAAAGAQSILAAGARALLIAMIGDTPQKSQSSADLQDLLNALPNSHPAFADPFLMDESGRVVAGQTPPTVAAFRPDSAHLARALAKNAFAGGVIPSARASDAPLFSFGQRLSLADGRSLALVMGVRPSYYQLLLDGLSINPGSRLYLADMRGRTAFTLPVRPGYPPEIPAPILAAVTGHGPGEGSFLFGNPDERLMVTYRRIALGENPREPYLQAVLAAPLKTDGLEAGVAEPLFLALAALLPLLTMLVSVILIAPVKQMLAAAREYGQGNFSALPAGISKVRELAGLAESMNGLAESLEKHEYECVRAKNAAEAAARAKGEFLAIMSHEIRTPLNAIIGMAYLALRGGLTDRQRGYVDKIHEAGIELLRVTNSILELSRLDAGTTREENIPFAAGPGIRAGAQAPDSEKQ